MKVVFLPVCLISVFTGSASAIEFKAPAPSALQWQADLPDGACLAASPTAPHELVYMGNCVDKLPHGRGILLAGRKLFFVKFNSGREFERSANWQDPSVAAYRAAAEYQWAWHGIFVASKQFEADMPGPADSPTFVAATSFLARYGTQASQVERDAAQQEANKATAAALELATRVLRSGASARLTAEFLRKWPLGQGPVSPALRAEAETLLTQRVTQERLAQEAEQRRTAEAARQREIDEVTRIAARNKLAFTVCERFYPGMVARYDQGGFFGTADPYVVRYVNARQRTVTIEGTGSGNSLTYGQHRELACIDLWEKTK